MSEPQHDEAPEGAAAAAVSPEDAIRAAAAAATVVELDDFRPEDGGGGGDALVRCAKLPMNDTGNARRLQIHFGHRLMFVKGLGWLAWVGSHWSQQDGERLSMLWAQMTAARIRKEVRVLEEEGRLPDESDKAFAERLAKRAAWSIASGNHARLKAMRAELEPHMAVDVRTLDARPELFNVANGTLELVVDGDVGRVEFREHRPDDRLTRMSPVVYDPAAKAPRWERFVAEVQPDYERRLYLQRVSGYGMTGWTKEEKVLLNYGTGSNGKSTYWEVVAEVMGGYAVTLPFETFLADDHRTGGQATPDLARLPGVRLARTSEPEGGATFSEGMIKRITGTDMLTVRPLYQDQFEFRPQFKLVASFNAKPKVRGQDHGIWRRLDLLGWDQMFVDPWETEAHPGKPLKDKGLMEALRGELPGILNWMLEGFVMWGGSGLATPESVRSATDEYRSESNPLGQFVEACTQRGGWTRAAELFAAYKAWCRREAVDPLSNTAFGRRLGDMGVEKTKMGSIFWGLTVTDDGLLSQQAAAAEYDHG